MASIVPPGELVYGMQLQVQSQSTMYAEPWEADAGVAELAAMARAADDAGFFYIAVCDHVAIPRPLAKAMGTTWYDTMTTLGFLAGITSRTRLLSHVAVLPYRHPLMTAKAFATLDTLSNGRAIVGVGAGHAADEFATLGIDFAARGALLDEAIDVVKAALLDEFPEAQGPTWPVRDVGVAPRPVQQPRPPVWVGGSAPPSLRRAAEKGDGWLPQGTPRSKMPEQIAFIRAHREKVLGPEPIDLGCITEFLYVGDPAWDVGEHTLRGSPDAIAERLREFGAMGVDHLQVRFRSRDVGEAVDQITAFGAEVAPLLKGAGVA
jgi:probable F420-dependent oxidoreductase